MHLNKKCLITVSLIYSFTIFYLLYSFLFNNAKSYNEKFAKNLKTLDKIFVAQLSKIKLPMKCLYN